MDNFAPEDSAVFYGEDSPAFDAMVEAFDDNWDGDADPVDVIHAVLKTILTPEGIASLIRNIQNNGDDL